MTLSCATAAPAAPPDDGVPVAVGRDAVLAAFNRNRTTPQPAAPQPRPQRQAAPAEFEMTEEAWRFVLEGYVAGNVAWATKHGPQPGAPRCKIPRRVLKEFGFEPID